MERAISSAGEHYIDIVGVTGSIPVSPTMVYFRRLHWFFDPEFTSWLSAFSSLPLNIQHREATKTSFECRLKRQSNMLPLVILLKKGNLRWRYLRLQIQMIQALEA